MYLEGGLCFRMSSIKQDLVTIDSTMWCLARRDGLNFDNYAVCFQGKVSGFRSVNYKLNLME